MLRRDRTGGAHPVIRVVDPQTPQHRVEVHGEPLAVCRSWVLRAPGSDVAGRVSQGDGEGCAVHVHARGAADSLSVDVDEGAAGVEENALRLHAGMSASRTAPSRSAATARTSSASGPSTSTRSSGSVPE